MANPTTNFGWVMPTSTDLVTDLPADFAVFGQGVDTSFQYLKGGTTGQVLSKTSNTDLDFTWTTPTDQTPLTTKGDLFGYSTLDARIPIGTNNQVLTADSTQALGLKWATPAASTKSYSLIGSAALTGATTITVSGISGIDSLKCFVYNASSANVSAFFSYYFNGDTGANYNLFGAQWVAGATYVSGNLTNEQGLAQGEVNLARMGTVAAGVVAGYFNVDGCNTSGNKIFQSLASCDTNGNTGRAYGLSGYYTGSSTISSVTIKSSTGNFDSGTLYVYGAA